MKRNVMYATAMILTLTSCGKDCPTSVKEYVTAPVVQTDAIQRVVDDENRYRASVGQLPLTEGLTCSTYINLSNTLTAFPTSLPSANITYKYVGVFNQPNTNVNVGLNILPPAVRMQPAYMQWFAVRCSGFIVITDDNYYSYELTSDDASLLYINNVKVVDNNGNHGAQERTGFRQLRRGVHSFRLDYMQGPAGNQALILKSSGVIVPANVFVR